MDVLGKIAERVELNELIQKCYQEALNDLVSKGMHLKAIQRSVAENSKTLEEMQALMEEQITQLKAREVSFDLSTGNSEDLGLKKNELKYIHNSMAEQKKLMERFFENIELERKQFETNQKMTDDRFLEVCWKEINANLIKMQNDNRATELVKREENLEGRLKEIEMREVVLASRKAELIAKEDALEAREKNLELRKELDLKERELDSIKKSRENCHEILDSLNTALSGEQTELSKKRFRNGAVKSREIGEADHSGPSRRNCDIERSPNSTDNGGNSAQSDCDSDSESNSDSASGDAVGPEKIIENHILGHKVSDADLCTRDKLLSAPIDYSKSLINDFGKHRQSECFAVGQVWACYDSFTTNRTYANNHYMPRYYVKILEVLDISKFHFKVRVVLLLPPTDFWDWSEVRVHKGWKAWIKKGLPVGCGNLVRANNRMLYCPKFSHQMYCEDLCKPYRIYRRKGEIWALYKDWNITAWVSNPEHFRKCNYEIVEVLEAGGSIGSTKVAYLDRIVGFVSLFQRRSKDENDSFLIRRSDIFRFSHKVPSFKMTSNEIQGVQDGSFELDPKALPRNF